MLHIALRRGRVQVSQPPFKERIPSFTGFFECCGLDLFDNSDFVSLREKPNLM